MKKLISLVSFSIIAITLIGCFPEVAAPSLSRSMRMEAKASVVSTDARRSDEFIHVEPSRFEPSESGQHVFTRPEEFPAPKEGPTQLGAQYAAWRRECTEQFGDPSGAVPVGLRIGLVSGYLEARSPDTLTIKFLTDIATKANREPAINPKFLALFEYQQKDGAWRSDPVAFRLYSGTEIYAEEPADIRKLLAEHPDVLKQYLARSLDPLIRYLWRTDQDAFGFLHVFDDLRLAEIKAKPEKRDAFLVYVMAYLQKHPDVLMTYLSEYPDIPIMKRAFKMENGFHWKFDIVRDWSGYSPEYRIDPTRTVEEEPNVIPHDNRITVVEPRDVPMFRNGRLFVTTGALGVIDFNTIFAERFGKALQGGKEGVIEFVPDVAELRDDEGHRLGCIAYNKK